MGKYILKRVAMAIVTIWAIITITFFLMHAVPGDPFSKEGGKMPKVVYENLVKQYGLDKPLSEQYVIYLKNVAKFDFGRSMKSDVETVNQMIKRGFPVSARLGLQALCISLILGPLLGTFAAINQNKAADYVATVIAIIGVSVPSFVLGALFIQITATYFKGFPIGGWGSFKHTILPSLALSLMTLAYMARLMRSTMLEVLNQDYIKTARSKGIANKVVIFKHAVRNAILPIISSLGTSATNLLVGSFVIEKIFGIPGLGMFFVTSINNRDYPLIMGTTIFYSSILVFMILIVDILYMIIDPRIKLADGGE
ncbi:ABC transporter permease [Peptoanaerobacter stomatis]|uniref:ABC transporter permease n=1 Tax=Peptoanaerobacter stomatis TaxID=796937 RepID=UPI003FA03C0F